jgi:hypothetical protein
MVDRTNTNIIIRSAAARMVFPTVVISLVIVGVIVSATLEIELINVSYAQVTPGQNPMCDPSDTHINGTESRICGVPKTPSSSSLAAVNSTTTPTIAAPQKSLPPSSTPSTTTPPSDNTIAQGAIPGLLP